VGSLIFFTVSASAPMTVLAGGVATTYAVTHSVGVPLSFPILGIALALFAVGYAAMTRYVENAGAFYAYLAVGLSRAWGVAGSAVAIVAYNTIQIGLYGLFGWALSGFAAAQWGLNWAWWACAIGCWAVVGVLGLFNVDLSAKVLGVFLIAEIAAVLLFDIGGFGHPAPGGVSTESLAPANLFTQGVGGVFAFGIAAFVGFESAAVYSSEVKDPRRTVARATYITVAITSVLYCVSAWALAVAAGKDALATGPQDPFAFVAAWFGDGIATTANVLFLTSVFAALLSFHMVVSRYTFAAGQEGVLPKFTAATWRRTGSPFAGSLLQSAVAIVTVAIFAILGRDPLLELFTWLSYVAAVGVLVLMIGTSLSVLGYFRGRDTVESVWQRIIAPGLSAVALIAITVTVVVNSDSILGTEQGSVLSYVLPGLIGLAVVAGLIWGYTLKFRRPGVYAEIGEGGAKQAAALAGLEELLAQSDEHIPA
jgi:amino acid transporter